MARSRKFSAPLSRTVAPEGRPFRSVAGQMRPGDAEAVAAAADAELRGDAASALHHHRSVPTFLESRHGGDLEKVEVLGGGAPGWLISRWLTEQARRGEWTGGHLNRQQDGLRVVVPALYPHGLSAVRAGSEHPEQVLAWINGRDWAVRQTQVYEFGHLRDVIEQHASPEVLARADHVEDWCDAPMGGYRLGPTGDGSTSVVDLATGAHLDVLDLGFAETARPAEHLIGRLVPTDAGPGLMWDSRPLAVEPSTATAVAKSPLRWLLVLRMKQRADRLPEAFSYQPDVSWTADLPCKSWLTLIGEAPGLRPYEVSDLVERAMVEVLRLAVADPVALAAARHRAAELVLDPMLTEAARARYATGDRLDAWRALGETLPSPARERCLTMAMSCGAAA